MRPWLWPLQIWPGCSTGSGALHQVFHLAMLMYLHHLAWMYPLIAQMPLHWGQQAMYKLAVMVGVFPAHLLHTLLQVNLRQKLILPQTQKYMLIFLTLPQQILPPIIHRYFQDPLPPSLVLFHALHHRMTWKKHSKDKDNSSWGTHFQSVILILKILFTLLRLKHHSR